MLLFSLLSHLYQCCAFKAAPAWETIKLLFSEEIWSFIKTLEKIKQNINQGVTIVNPQVVWGGVYLKRLSLTQESKFPEAVPVEGKLALRRAIGSRLWNAGDLTCPLTEPVDCKSAFLKLPASLTFSRFHCLCTTPVPKEGKSYYLWLMATTPLLGSKEEGSRCNHWEQHSSFFAHHAGAMPMPAIRGRYLLPG